MTDLCGQWREGCCALLLVLWHVPPYMVEAISSVRICFALRTVSAPVITACLWSRVARVRRLRVHSNRSKRKLVQAPRCFDCADAKSTAVDRSMIELHDALQMLVLLRLVWAILWVHSFYFVSPECTRLTALCALVRCTPSLFITLTVTVAEVATVRLVRSIVRHSAFGLACSDSADSAQCECSAPSGGTHH